MKEFGDSTVIFPGAETARGTRSRPNRSERSVSTVQLSLFFLLAHEDWSCCNCYVHGTKTCSRSVSLGIREPLDSSFSPTLEVDDRRIIINEQGKDRRDGRFEAPTVHEVKTTNYCVSVWRL